MLQQNVDLIEDNEDAKNTALLKKNEVDAVLESLKVYEDVIAATINIITIDTPERWAPKANLYRFDSQSAFQLLIARIVYSAIDCGLSGLSDAARFASNWMDSINKAYLHSDYKISLHEDQALPGFYDADSFREMKRIVDSLLEWIKINRCDSFDSAMFRGLVIRKITGNNDFSEFAFDGKRTFEPSDYDLENFKTALASSDNPEDNLLAVNLKGRSLMFVKNQTNEICLEAVRQSAYALEWVRAQNEEICLLAIHDTSYVLRFVHDITESVLMAAFLKSKEKKLSSVNVIAEAKISSTYAPLSETVSTIPEIFALDRRTPHAFPFEETGRLKYFNPKEHFPICSKVELQKFLESPSSDRDLVARNREFGKQMASRGMLRAVGAPEDAAKSIEMLRHTHPNFEEVIEFIGFRLAVSSRSTTAQRIPAMLLNGSPGVGKTHFAYALAAALGTTVRRVAMDTAIASHTISGSDKRWGNTAPGIVFDVVVMGKHANPIIVLDELDKAGQENRSGSNPLAPLHTLLEPITARNFRDLSVDFEFDASMVTWIATSNNIDLIPASLRSRFREFNIQLPNAEGSLLVAQQIISDAVKEMGLYDFSNVSRPVAVALAPFPARLIRQIVEQAISQAIFNNRSSIQLRDLPPSLLDGLGRKTVLRTNASFH